MQALLTPYSALNQNLGHWHALKSRQNPVPKLYALHKSTQFKYCTYLLMQGDLHVSVPAQEQRQVLLLEGVEVPHLF